ncbi:hypothetical protein N9079_02595 [bacterium]|nr:hypothetical protein [bacterium]
MVRLGDHNPCREMEWYGSDCSRFVLRQYAWDSRVLVGPVCARAEGEGALGLRVRTSHIYRWGMLGPLDRPYSVWRDTLTRMECVLHFKLSFAVKEGYGQRQQVQPENQLSTCYLDHS